jgi:hypothetical protein
MPVIVAACVGAARLKEVLRSIDLHCHILPELDDGALDRRGDGAMARQAARAWPASPNGARSTYSGPLADCRFLYPIVWSTRQ